jgi:cytochrome oxidase assembly protein ShyY1
VPPNDPDRATAGARRLRAARIVAFGLLAAAVCIRLGVWQLDRLEQRRAANARILHGLAAPPLRLDAAASGEDLAFRRATVRGRWDPAHEVILYGRPLEGRPGNHVLTPLVLGDGRALLVDRGWVPAEIDAGPVGGGAAAVGVEVEVTGTLLPADGGGAPASSPVRVVRSVDVALLDAQIPSDLIDGVYLLLASQRPAVDEPVPAPLPELTEGPHRSYAIQWFLFAAIALVGSVLLARRDAG